jgi:hypothetical protein
VSTEPDHTDYVDPKVAFYLEHRETIETWHALRSEAHAACAAALEQAVPSIMELAEEHGLRVTDARTGQWRIVAVAPTDSHIADDATPLCAVAISWNDKVILDDPSDCPCVGVRVARSDPNGPATWESVRVATRDERKRRGAKRSPWWPVWAPVQAPAGWWHDPQPYLDELLGVTADYLEAFGDVAAQHARPTT